MPRAKIWGYLSVVASAGLFGFLIFSIFIINYHDFSIFESVDLKELTTFTFYSVAIPIVLVSIFVMCTGFWIGWIILTIKVVPPMPEIMDKNDNSKIKAFFLCLTSALLLGFLIFGILKRNFWALAIPALVISTVVLGAVFWVGMAIITTRSTLPVDKK